MSARLQELEQASLLQRGIPFYPVQNTSHTLLPFKVVGISASTMYALIPLVINQTRLRRILEKIEGFEKAKSWLLDLAQDLRIAH